MRINTVFPLLLCLQVYSQYPSLTLHRSMPVSATSFAYRNCFLNKACYEHQEKIKTEVPPWIIEGNRKAYFFVDGRESHIWNSTAPLTQPVVDLKATGSFPVQITQPYIREPGYSATRPVRHWKRNYHAVYSAHSFRHLTQGPVALGFCHSENKNESAGNCHTGPWYQNTIQPNVPINCRDSNTWSGGQPYHDGWLAYNGFLTAVWTPDPSATGGSLPFFRHELGPIAWPSNGYVTKDGVKTTAGLRHPSSLLHNDSLYIFFVDAGVFGNNIRQEEGRTEGIRVIRAHKDQALHPSGYTIYYKGPDGLVSWVPALPSGLTPENLLQYVSVKGPRSTDLFGDSGLVYQEIRFSVARIKNSAYFIGVEQYMDLTDLNPQRQPRVKVALRFSRNLTDWSERQLMVHTADSWQESRLNYPIFLSKDGASNTEIDLDDFYIAGAESAPGDHINKIRVLRDPQLQPVPQDRALGGFSRLMLANGNARPEAVDFSIRPNPSAGLVTVHMHVAAASRVRISLYNSMGQRVGVLLEETVSRGHTRNFNLADYAAGLYIMELLVNGIPYTKKIIRQ